MGIDLIRRKEWGARRPRHRERIGVTRGVKVHYVGERVDRRLLTDHTRCMALVKAIQAQHMDGNGWADIAYSALVCPHGRVFVGRGPHVLTAANGPGLNEGHYSVCGLLGDKGLTDPPAAMLDGIRDAIEWLREEGDAGREIKGHRDGYATSCPGKPLYAWVKDGAPRPGAGPGADWTETLVRKLPTLRRGDKGEDVQTLQGLLRARSHREVKISGDFDEKTEEALKELQEWGGVPVNGVCGKRTWPVLLRLHT